MKNINNITTKEEAHCFLGKEIASMANLLKSKGNGLNKKVDFYMEIKNEIQEKYGINVDSYDLAVNAILKIKSYQQDTFIENNIKELRDLNKKYEDKLDEMH